MVKNNIIVGILVLLGLGVGFGAGSLGGKYVTDSKTEIISEVGTVNLRRIPFSGVAGKNYIAQSKAYIVEKLDYNKVKLSGEGIVRTLRPINVVVDKKHYKIPGGKYFSIKGEAQDTYSISGTTNKGNKVVLKINKTDAENSLNGKWNKLRFDNGTEGWISISK